MSRKEVLPQDIIPPTSVAAQLARLPRPAVDTARLLREAQDKANELSYMLTNLINATPTGDRRNELTSANIHCALVEGSLKIAARK